MVSISWRAMAANVEGSEIFNNLSSKIANLLHGRTEGDRNILSKVLDDLNSLNYRYPVVTNPTKAVLLVNQCCSFISTDDDVLVQKYSHLLWLLIKKQHVPVEGRSLVVAINWCLDSSLSTLDKNVVLEVLQALEALLRINIDNIVLLTDKIVQIIIKIIRDGENKWSSEVILVALQCLEACTAIPSDFKSTNRSSCLENCSKIFISHLSRPRIVEDLVHIKMLQISLYGLQNIITQDPEYLKKDLGLILGIIKTFMVFGIKGIDFITPQKLASSTMSIPEIPNIREKKGGKMTKQRKQKSSTGPRKDTNNIEDNLVSKTAGYNPATMILDNNSDNGMNVNNFGNKLKTSDSDFSDNEANKSVKISQTESKVRQASFSLFYNVIKNSEKSTIFSYWTSFIPEGTISGPHNLVVSILKDPSSRCRTSALNVLLILLTTSKLYLAHAEYSDRQAAFTTFSMVLGLMIKELHRGLCLALNEKSVPVLVQILKCLAALVQATPYHKMHPGLIAKVVRNVKPFVYHKDATVQVTALIAMGCVVTAEPVIPETKKVMLKMNLEHVEVTGSNTDGDNEVDLENIDYAEFSDSSDCEGQEDEVIPWLLKRCICNLGVKINAQEPLKKDERPVLTVPAPVKLESLQVISAMSRNYFDVLLAPYLSYITTGITLCLSDQYTDLKLHAGRAVEFIGQEICRYIASQDKKDSVPLEHFLAFWETLFGGPLIDLLQCVDQPNLRSIGCDCLGTIGSDIFEQLPRDKQILCITLLFSCTRDDEHVVKAAAVRALAICVMYSSLREDPGFVVDTAEAIYRTLNDQNFMVRIKASWSLGNLSDALVLNSKAGDIIEEIPEDLILKLLQVSIKGASDHDKIKMNCVRALGNFVQLINDDLMKKTKFSQMVDKTFEALVKNCTSGSNMKVKWNTCYAIGNALKNSAFYQNSINCNKSWQGSVYKTLTDLVINCKNFKVRINAALALAAPISRENFGNFYYLTWTALLEALENSQNMEDLSEYTHRDHLVEQVCLSLGHLTTLLQKDDLVHLKDTIDRFFEVFHRHTQKVLERLVPEKSASLTAAGFALNQLSQDNLNNAEIDVANRLKTVFLTSV